jgi:hypothetical protein
VRFFSVGIGLNIALCGLTATNLAAVAEPPPVNNGTPALSYSLQIPGTSGIRVIRGTGVEFSVPSSFNGGVPASADTKAVTTEAKKLYPSMSSVVNALEADPTFLRAMAISTTKQDPQIVLINQLPVPGTVGLDELHEMMSKMLPSVLPNGFKLVEHKIETVGSRQIVRLTVDVDLEGTKFTESIGMFKEGNELFQVTYVHSGENPRQARPVFDRMITSFKTIPTAAVTTSAN